MSFSKPWGESVFFGEGLKPGENDESRNNKLRVKKYLKIVLRYKTIGGGGGGGGGVILFFSFFIFHPNFFWGRWTHFHEDFFECG